MTGIVIRKMLKFIYPLVVLISKTHLPFTRKRITGKEYYKWLSYLKEGDVFLTTTRGEFSNLINPSEWKHGAIYYGEINGIHYVYESTGKGVYKKDLVSFLTSKDHVKILRHKDLTTTLLMDKYLESIEGRPYDRVFSTENQSFYCFEIIAEALKMTMSDYAPVMETILGELIYTDKTFTKDKDFILVAKSENK